MQRSPTPHKKQPPSQQIGSLKQVPERTAPPVVKGSRRRRAPTRRSSGQAANLTQDEDNMTMATVEENDPQPNEVARKKSPAEIALENFALSLSRKKIDGLKAEFKELQNFKPSPQDSIATACVANKDKNRYNNVICYDKTRVILTNNVPPDTDYINGNWVSSNLITLTNKYICTQAPTDFTTNDFWRMVWQEKVKHIVMLCGVLENGKQKCAQYYPLAVNESKLYGTILVTNKRNATLASERIYESTVFEVLAEGFADPLTLTLMRWLDWPDFGIPQSGMGMLRILKTIRDDRNSTALIHCSAGVGRTGTIMACEICLRILLEGKELNVPDVVKELRVQRAGSIQTESQYVYLHRTLSEYCHAKKLVKEELSKFFAAFADYRKALIKAGVGENQPAQIQQPGVAFSKPI